MCFGGEILGIKSKKEINIEIGKNIRNYRERAGYSREKFSEIIGISPRFLADVETGFVGISVKNLKRICEILGISSDRLLWKNENKLSLDERIAHIEPKYFQIVEEIIQKQLEFIAISNTNSVSSLKDILNKKEK